MDMVSDQFWSLSIKFVLVKHLSSRYCRHLSLLAPYRIPGLACIVPALFIVVFLSACHEGTSTASRDGRSDSSRTTGDSTVRNFFPIGDFLQSEIAYVDSTPLAIRKYEEQNNKTDSVYIQQEVFNRLAAQFVLPELDPDSFQKNYQENAFQDATTGYVTLTYTPRDKEASLQRVDVLSTMAKGAGKIRSIYLERIERRADTLEIKKLYWKARQSFQIVTSWQVAQKAPIMRQVRVVWDSE